MANHRNWDRYTHDKRLVLALSDGRTFQGQSRDVSLSGLFFLTEDDTTQVSAKETGTLRLTAGDGAIHSFPCEVVRKTPEGIALNLTNQQAEFGFVISQDIFYDLKAKGARKKRGSQRQRHKKVTS